MNFLIISALTLAAVFALPSEELKPRSIALPAGEPKGRVIDGQRAKPAEFPFQVGLLWMHSNLQKFWCGGVLISSTRVLTAGHCTEKAIKIQLYLGSLIRQSAPVIYNVYTRDIILHPGWRSDTLENDISLIRIPLTIFSAYIQPVALPTSLSTASSYVGQTALVSGWGFTSDSSKAFSTYLEYAKVQIIPSSVCKKFYARTISNLCASTYNGASCNGDSGGPLILADSRILVGITSFGNASCQHHAPVAFTEVVKYLNWIRQNSI